MFDTPGSQVSREMSATVTFDIKTNNVSVLLHSAGNFLIAKGKYLAKCTVIYQQIMIKD